MTNITKTNNKKSLVEIVTEERCGRTIEFVCIDGIKLDGSPINFNEAGMIGMGGAVCTITEPWEVEFIQNVVDNSDKRGVELVFEVANAFQMAGKHHELGIPTDDKPDVVDVNGKTMSILYSKKTIYNSDLTEEIANCNDLPDMPKEAIKAVLIERAKNAC